jgi:hypothetical protein
MTEDKITMIGLTENEVKIFLKLREIEMRGGSVKINYDDNNLAQTMDLFRHCPDLSTGLSTTYLTSK